MPRIQWFLHRRDKRIGSVAVTLAELQCAASATFIPPTATGSVAVTLAELICASSGVFFPPQFLATVSASLPALVCEANASHPEGVELPAFRRMGTGLHETGQEYPFVAPSEEVRHLFADAYLAHETFDAVLPLRVYWMHGFTDYITSPGSLVDAESLESVSDGDSAEELEFTPRHAADLVVTDATGRVVFDSTEVGIHHRVVSFGENYYLHEWMSDDVVCRVLQNRGWGAGDTVTIPPSTFYPVSAVLDEYVSEIMPRRVRSIRVGLTTVAGGHLVLRNGYNTVLTPTETPFAQGRTGAELQISAAAGGGLGRFPSCEQAELLVRTINDVGPRDRGEFILAARECYYVRPPLVEYTEFSSPIKVFATDFYDASHPEYAHLRVGNDCGPCCACEDFENVYLAMRNLYDQFIALGQRAEATRDLYHENIARWEAQRECREARLVRVVALAHSQRYIEVAAAICNNTTECIQDVELQLEVVLVGDTLDRTSYVVDCSTFISTSNGQTAQYELAGEHPTYVAVWDSLRPKQTGHVRFRLGFVPSGSTNLGVQITATGFVQGEPWPTAETAGTSSTVATIGGC